MRCYISKLLMVIIFCVLSLRAAQAQIIDLETFGSGPAVVGPELPAGQITYDYNPVAIQPANFPDILNDGQYVLATDPQIGFTNWSSIGDNTTGTGYMLLVNADGDLTDEFYRRRVTLTPNTSFDFLVYAVNVNSQADFDFCTGPENGNGELVLANITLQIEALDGTILASQDTGDIPFNPVPVWEEYGLNFSTNASTSDIDIVLINNSLGGCGNDLAIDDITFRVAVTIEASDDSLTVTNTATQQNDILFVGANDTLNDNPLPGSELYFIEPPTVLPPELLFDTDTGAVSVLAGTPSGTYSFEYRVCETANEFNCDTSMVTITVDLPPVDIVAQNDSGSVFDSSLGNSSVLNVLGNDTIDGAAPTNFDLSLAAGETLPAGLTFDTDTGEVVVLQGTPTSTLSFDYLLCEAGDPDNCESASVTINVTNPNPPSVCPIGTAVTTGTFHALTVTGGSQNVDQATGAPLPEGTAPANSPTPASGMAITNFPDVIYTLTDDVDVFVPEGEIIQLSFAMFFGSSANFAIEMSRDGLTYTNVGSVASVSNSYEYEDFTVPAGGARFVRFGGVNVRFDGAIYNTQCTEGAAPPSVTIEAEDDEGDVLDSSLGDTVVLNVLDNDLIDGAAPVSGDFELSLADGETLPAGLTFDTSTGAVTVLQDTPTDTLTFNYIICETGNEFNCETQMVTINVTNPNPPSVCPIGTAVTTGTFHALTVTGGSQNVDQATGAPLPEGTAPANSPTPASGMAITNFPDVIYTLTDDVDVFVPEGEIIQLSFAMFFGSSANFAIEMSRDGLTYTNVGSVASVSNSYEYEDFTVPAGGARFVRFGGVNVRFDGAIYNTQCAEGAAEPVTPNVSVVKTVAMFDPAEYAIPGNDIVYTITVTNSGDGVVDNDTLELIDVMPSEVAFFNMSPSPVTFTDNGSGLTFDVATDVGFSDAATAPSDFSACNYTPNPNDYDDAVTFICFNPKGTMNAMSSWSVGFRSQIN